ncbi:MAG TPA: monovalent cation:proton antiporter-2 (CPA2) family protein, partial [Kofleriaceae bacterium]|nr:monovalent cation:proton antiporter-2 (CPA2) family protein [Kofleriaceae bacterium]
MDIHPFLVRALVLLSATIVAVPLFRRLGLGAVLGYLAAGVALGPWGLALVDQPEAIRHFAELGVVLLMFVIGLEILPRRLWELRRSVFGLGGIQVLGTGAILAAIGSIFGLDAPAAIIAGLALALSSTAFALQLLAEKHQLTAPAGHTAFAILLFQDLAAIPLLAVVPLLGDSGGQSGAGLGAVLEGLGAFVAVVAGGRYLLRPIFRIIASARSHEVFTASALVLVIGVGLLMDAVGLSMAFGAFIAGVLLADSEYRHELQTDIEPFKGLLLGLFFLGVGMSVNLGLVAARPLVVIALVLGLVAVKVA